MNELVAITLGYSIVFLGTIFFLNFLTSGFILTFIMAKAGRGKKAIVEVYGVANIYYRIGFFDGSILKYKNSEGKQKQIKIDKGTVHRLFNVPNLKVDEEKNAVINFDFKSVAGFDAIKFDNLIVRALTMPQIENQKEKILVALILVAMILALVFIGYKVINIESMVMRVAGRGVVN